MEKNQCARDVDAAIVVSRGSVKTTMRINWHRPSPRSRATTMSNIQRRRRRRRRRRPSVLHLYWRRIQFSSISFTVLVVLLVALFLLPVIDATLSKVLMIAPFDEECFMLKTPAWPNIGTRPRQFQGDFELLDTGLDEKVAATPVLVLLLSETGEHVYYASAGQAAGTFDISLRASTKYWLCVQNAPAQPATEINNAADRPELPPPPHPDDQPRHIGLSWRIVDAVTQHVDVQQTTTTWQQHGHKLHMAMRRLQHHFEYLKSREAAHRTVTERTFADILWWTMGEASMVLAVAGGQVWYLRRYVERKQRYL